MAIRYFALAYGVVFLLVGAAGFVPAFLAPYDAGHPELLVHANEGLLFGLFPVNLLHNLTHLAFGLWGIVAWRSQPASTTYAKAVALIYGLFVIMGLIPGVMTVFGFVPLHGHDIWLHALLAGVAIYFVSVRREGGYSANRTTSGGYATGNAPGGSGRTVTTDEPRPLTPSTTQGTGAETRYAAGDRSADAPYAPGAEQGDSQYASGSAGGSQKATPANAGGMGELDRTDVDVGRGAGRTTPGGSGDSHRTRRM